MPIKKDLFLAILSMDAYNRGYNAGIILDDAVGTKVGAATISKRIDDIDGFKATAQAAGFYAVAYDVPGARVDGLSDTTVISYRGTDQPGSEFPFTDFPLSFAGDWRDPQIELAHKFFKPVDATTANSLHLTGHSLGGALAGFTGVVNDAEATLVDHIGFTRGLNSLLAAYGDMKYIDPDTQLSASYLELATHEEARNKYFLLNGLIEGTNESLLFLSNWDWLKKFGFDDAEGLNESRLRDFIDNDANAASVGWASAHAYQRTNQSHHNIFPPIYPRLRLKLPLQRVG